MAKISELHVREWARVLPDVAKLTWRVARDRRVPLAIRIGLGGLVVYLASPIDIIPDWIPFAGHLDDAVVTLIGLRSLLRRVPETVLVELWPGDVDLLGKLIGKELVSSHPTLPEA